MIRINNPTFKNISHTAELPTLRVSGGSKLIKVISSTLNILSKEGCNSKKRARDYLEAVLEQETGIDIDSLGTEGQHIINHFLKK